jgi:two-component system, NtrC family, sensor kinase
MTEPASGGFDLPTFSLGDMLRCGQELRDVASAGRSMETVAQAVVRFLHDAFRHPQTGERQCLLVRFYKTHRYAALPTILQSFARLQLGADVPSDDMRCLTLLATAGLRDEWNDRRRSRRHRAIPLPSEAVVERTPMIAQLIRQLGLDVATVISPSTELVAAAEGRTYDVFHVERAAGSPFIPAQQDFVVPYSVESVIGFGGLVGDEMFAVIVFAAVVVPPDAAKRFRNIALDVKSSVYQFRESSVFEPLAET